MSTKLFSNVFSECRIRNSGCWKKGFFLLSLLTCILILPACGAGGEDPAPEEPEENVLIYAALNPVSSVPPSPKESYERQRV